MSYTKHQISNNYTNYWLLEIKYFFLDIFKTRRITMHEGFIYWSC